MRKHLGFTLIEVLIAVSLLSMIMLAGIYSYSVFTSQWGKELKQFQGAKNKIQGLYQLQDTLSNIKPYVIATKRDVGFLFVGDESSLFAVRNNSMFDIDSSEVFKLSLQRGPESKSNLIIQSATLEKQIVLTEEDKINYVGRFTLLEGVSNFKIKYYGFSNRMEKVNSNDTGIKPRWHKRYSGVDSQLLPSKVLITFSLNGKPAELVINLDNNPERHLSSYIEVNT